MRDINPSQNRSIRNIPVPPGHRSKVPPRPPSVEEDYHTPPPPPRPRKRGGKGRRFLLLALGVVLIFGALGLAVSVVFAGATVRLNARAVKVTAPATLEAALNAPLGTIPLEQVSIQKSATTSVTATGTTRVSRQASGVVIIYNSYSTASQKLIANTRFEAPDGKIYRVRDSVTVPGGARQSDGSLKPGSVTATLYADSPGESYNRSGNTTYTIPGFKGDPRYSGFSAESRGPIQGGFVGDEPTVSQSELQKARTTLEQQLDSMLRAELTKGLPEGAMLLPGTLRVSYGELRQEAQGSKATISQSATAVALVVREADLASAIARRTVEGYKGEAVGFSSLEELKIALATTSKVTDPRITLTAQGTPTLVWQFDPNAIKQALLGKEKSSFEQTIQAFAPAVLCTEARPCQASIRPFWQGSFPSEAESIKVVIDAAP